MSYIIEINNLSKQYGNQILFDNFNCRIEKNKFTVIMGKSGSGKSTLLNMIGLLDKPNQGSITLFNQTNIKPFSHKAEKLLRNKIGYLFQNYALIDNETVFNNLKIVCHGNRKNIYSNINQALKQVGLAGFINKKISECSGGEQQRVAIARLILKPCELILADEPTGSLDEENKKLVFSLLQEFVKNNKTVLVVSHDPDIKSIADCIINL